jgi:hypothetical protein
VETDATDYSSDSDHVSDKDFSQPASSPFYDEPWTIGNFRPKKLTFSLIESDYT